MKIYEEESKDESFKYQEEFPDESLTNNQSLSIPGRFFKEITGKLKKKILKKLLGKSKQGFLKKLMQNI